MPQPIVDLDLARSFGLSEEEWHLANEALGRAPTYPELGVISVMWSEHCSYKSSRVHLKRLPTEGPQVVQGPGENAGAVDIGHGYCAVFKMESHNHPSFIEPYQGAATGVGGILRDVFTMGARPIASLNSLRFGSPDHPKTPHLLRGVVAGIGGYGNCIGVPTVGGELQFDPSYDGNILVNAFTVGIARSDRLFYGKAEGVGSPVLYVGAHTGRDGIHGATMASAEFAEETDSKLPTVQVGDPFKEKLLLEACLEIFELDCLSGIQDMGAAGLTSSSVEMAERAGNGIELDLDLIPRRALNLEPYELLLSESQERMLMVAKPGHEQRVLDVCAKWDLQAAVVGRVTDTGRFVCLATSGYDPLQHPVTRRDPQVVVDLSISLLSDAAPRYDRPQSAPAMEKATDAPKFSDDLQDEVLRAVGSPNLGSRSWVWRQYDHIVRDGTVARPGESDAAIVRAFLGEGEDAEEVYLALSVDGNGRHVQLDPFNGAAMVVAECARNIVCAGGQPLGATDCLNFGSPEKPETVWRFARAIDGLSAACKALSVPIVSGNVSLYNETDGRPVLPTPAIAMVGKLRSAEDRLGLALQNEGDRVVQLGPPSQGRLGGSEWWSRRHGKVELVQGDAPRIDLELEQRLQNAIVAMAQQHVLRSAHDISEGGFAVALAEMCISGQRGAEVKIPRTETTDAAAALFSEEPSRVLVSIAPDRLEHLQAICASHDVPWETIGQAGGNALKLEDLAVIPLTKLSEAHAKALDGVTATQRLA